MFVLAMETSHPPAGNTSSRNSGDEDDGTLRGAGGVVRSACAGSTPEPPTAGGRASDYGVRGRLLRDGVLVRSTAAVHDPGARVRVAVNSPVYSDEKVPMIRSATSTPEPAKSTALFLPKESWMATLPS